MSRASAWMKIIEGSHRHAFRAYRKIRGLLSRQYTRHLIRKRRHCRVNQTAVSQPPAATSRKLTSRAPRRRMSANTVLCKTRRICERNRLIYLKSRSVVNSIDSSPFASSISSSVTARCERSGIKWLRLNVIMYLFLDKKYEFQIEK